MNTLTNETRIKMIDTLAQTAYASNTKKAYQEVIKNCLLMARSQNNRREKIKWIKITQGYITLYRQSVK